MSLTVVDKRILNRLQEDIRFTKKPWKNMADNLDIEESILLRRIKMLKKKGVIRRISATFNPGKVGYVSTLVAAKVAPKNVDKVAARINVYDEVTHNYERDDEYNLWFTLIAKNRRTILRILNEIEQDKEIIHVLELPAVRLFKIGAKFKA